MILLFEQSEQRRPSSTTQQHEIIHTNDEQGTQQLQTNRTIFILQFIHYNIINQLNKQSIKKDGDLGNEYSERLQQRQR